MIRPLSEELLAERLLAPTDTVVVGVSGGGDSMALLHLLLGLNQTMEWQLKLHVAHLNHQLRGLDSEKDAGFVQAAADGLDLPATIEVQDIRKLAAESGIGVEEKARQQRYLFFERVCRTAGAKAVSLGHHADDQAETVLHRILRGTGLRGLSGMARSRPIRTGCEIRVVRPLLRYPRKALREFLSDQGIAFREDESNRSAEPMRNRIRQRIIPLLEQEVNPQVAEALVRLGEQAGWLQEFLRETVEQTFQSLMVQRNDQMLVLNAEALSRKSRIVQTELVRMAYRSFGLGEQELAFHHLMSALDLIADPTSGRQAHLPTGMVVEKRYGQLIFAMASDEPRETISEEVAVRMPGITTLPVRGWEIRCNVMAVAPDQIPRLKHRVSPMEEHMNLEAIRPPLVIRERRPGDRFVPLGAPGSKKLSDFLADAHIPPAERERIAVLCDQLGPIWVVGLRMDDRVKLTSLTRNVLHVQANPLPVS